ncbi:LIM domain-containing protein A-like [Takifugu rubripes]|uniref:LIM domain-containing protein A-like n=1 Tax=Takifugu rubripes TaxID=31033 RepID=UPI001145659A|nr:LIM domain-containing protein A-like [Takifugu rubripes]
MCDHQLKEHSHGRIADPRPQQMKQHHQNPGHHRHRDQRIRHNSDGSESHDTNSTADDSIFSDRPVHQQKCEDVHHREHSHHYQQRQNHRHASRAETLSSSSTGSSSSSSSVSSSASSFSSSSSSSSSLSSDTSSNYVDPYSVKKSRHSRSCTDISRKHKYSEEGDDTAPLIDQNSCPNRLPDKEDQRKAKSHGGSPQGTLKNTKKIARGSGKNGSFRKAKSMEALSRPKERDWPTDEDESGEEKKKGEAVTNVMKEKKKFSAFLNEITRQVLSPMRLTTLGVTDAQRASVGSTRSTGRTEKTRQQKGLPACTDSSGSSKYSHARKQSSRCSHSTQPSHSQSFHHGHRTADSFHHQARGSAEAGSMKRRHSWSQSLHHRSHSPSIEHHYHHQDDDHHTFGHHHHHHRDHHNTGHRTRSRHHSPNCHYRDHPHATHLHDPYHRDHHHHYCTEGHHSPEHRHYHGDHHSPGHGHHHRDHHIPGHRGHHEEHHCLNRYHHHGDQYSSVQAIMVIIKTTKDQGSIIIIKTTIMDIMKTTTDKVIIITTKKTITIQAIMVIMKTNMINMMTNIVKVIVIRIKTTTI